MTESFCSLEKAESRRDDEKVPSLHRFCFRRPQAYWPREYHINNRIVREMESDHQESNEKQHLQDRIQAQDEEIRALKKQVARLESERINESNSSADLKEEHVTTISTDESLSAQQIERYSRQLLLNDGFGVQGQLMLLSSSVLVIGAGGIGSTGTSDCEE